MKIYKSKTTIFITGIHGVGKSTICKKASESLGIQSFSAGEIIQKKRNLKSTTDKNILDISENQTLLLAGIKDIKEHCNKFILDGHIALLTKDNVISTVEFKIIKQINPTVIVLIKDNPSNIQRRLYQRDRQDYSLDLLDQMQNIEQEQGILYAKELNCEFYEINLQESSLPDKNLINFLSKYLYD